MQEREADNAVTIDILGDISLAWYTGDLEICRTINEWLGKADYRIANLESPFLCGGEHQPIAKEAPGVNLGIDEKYVDFIKELNIHAYTLANNHFGDYGEKGARDTIDILRNLEKQYVGSALEYENTYTPLRVLISGFQISFISVCENEFGIARDGKIGAAGFQTEKIKKVLEKEKKRADFVVVIFNGGTEHYTFATPKQKKRYNWLADAGADIVVGMHQHCPARYEYYQDSIIVYSVGNFFFPRKNAVLYENWYAGYAARFHINADRSIDFCPMPYRTDQDGKTFREMDSNTFFPYYYEISRIIQNEEELEQLYKGWIFHNGTKLYRRLKHCIGEDDNTYSFNIVKNLLSCEAHNELLTAYVNQRYYELDADYTAYYKIIQRYMNIFHYGAEQKETKSKKTAEKYVLWGAGEKAERIYRKLKPGECIITVIDRDCEKQGFYFMESRIEPPVDTVITSNLDAVYYICTSEKYLEEIRSYLLSYGILEQKIRKG